MSRARWLLPWLTIAGGWRGDGSGVTPDADVPTSWTADDARWTFPLPAWGNASPVWFEGQVCVTAEPAEVLCVEAATGRLSWRATVSPLDALTGEARARATTQRDEATALDARQLALSQAYSKARQALRRDPAGPARDAIAAITTELGGVRNRLAELSDARLPPPDDTVGWMTPTPVVHDGTLYVSASSGVVGAFDRSGQRRWTVDLGRAGTARRGYTGPPTASPVWVANTLVVVGDHLTGLDPATGAVRWRDTSVYPDFGTPAVLVDRLATPDGRLLAAADGRELQQDLGDLWYVGPHAADGSLYYLGSTGDQARPGTTHAARWDVSADGGLRATWQVPLPTDERFYAGPLRWGERLVAVSKPGTLIALSASDGHLLHQAELALPLGAEVWPSPLVAGSHLLVPTDRGVVLVLDATFQEVGRGTLGRMLATPLAHADTLYLRTRDALVAIGP